MAGLRVELNIYDVSRMVHDELKKRFPGHVIIGFDVCSWNAAPILSVDIDDGVAMMTEPVRHRVRPDHATLDWDPS